MNYIAKQKGFTLIEATLTLIILSIMGSMMYSYFNFAMAHGAIPLIQVQKSLELQSAMEKITADYYDIIGNGDNLDKLKISEGASECIPSGCTPPDCTICNYKYGKYGITNNVFIKFDSGKEVELKDTDPDPKNILKITINNDLGEELTSLFTDPNL